MAKGSTRVMREPLSRSALGVVLLSLLGSVAFSHGACAADKMPSPPLVAEVRLGVLSHGNGGVEQGTDDLSGEILFQKLPLESWDLPSVLVPQPHIGGDINLSGKTNTIYAGLTWHWPLPLNFFAEGEFGAGFTNGRHEASVSEGRTGLGCNAAFREAISLGYQLTQSVSLMVLLEHMSNANLCTPNSGLTNYGLRLGFRF